MNKLKNKVFFTIWFILLISILSYIIVFNSQEYLNAKSTISNSLETFLTNNSRIDSKEEINNKVEDDNKVLEESKELGSIEDIRFIDSTIYTVLLNDNNKIIGVINNSNNTLEDEEIKEIASNLLNDVVEGEYIHNLYFNKYSYYYLPNSMLVIYDNSGVQSELYSLLLLSVLIFIVLSIISGIISYVIAKWITKPVLESFEKQRQFVADASHELKTPLSVIMASSDALESNPTEDKWLKNIKMESERMNKLITDLLNLASSERKIELTKNNLSKIIELSILPFEGIAYEKGLKIKYDVEEDIYMLMNEGSIQELLEILIDNAIKHAKSKSIINILLKTDNNNIVLIVENYGDEIPKGEEEKIFERFYRVDKSRDRKENRYGLGLSIAKNIVLNHNGKIEALSKNGKTTFKVTFKK